MVTEPNTTVLEASTERTPLCYRQSADESLTEAIVTAVCDRADADTTELSPLYATIDPDALESLLGSRADGSPRNSYRSVAFEYESYHVQVESGGLITVN
ncbi:hypothetical protein SAMN06269185_0625 [Natronoarchaeum philippinense]|uniref:Halobacterial output domain-containing protein n=1 Tax=Natronoarchaeum philippinense TaxID=558529 RepID=A0A285N5B9_NATPI|nr:HalOD1 output domain-containing protein [Natronoarchaeum philippinense]SNZ04629.1 hypothetical protein SAMN06269185_0625 [Natronoarchaeum philippinense]